MTTWYASPWGAGDGKSPWSPCLVAQALDGTKPGDLVRLMPGLYRGEASMIRPREGLERITVAAWFDGTAWIDGEGVRRPVLLARGNHQWILRDFDACNSPETVVEIDYSDDCTVRRVCAWDAGERNTYCFAVHYGERALFEDCAGWGIARKVFDCSQQGNGTTFRRCYGRWDGSHVVGPKAVFSCAYDSRHNLFDSCVAVWGGRRMTGDPYQVLGYDGKPYPGKGVLAGTDIDQPIGCFVTDGFTSDFAANSILVNCVALAPAGAPPMEAGFYLGFQRETGWRVERCTSVVLVPATDGCHCAPFRLTGPEANIAEGLRAAGPNASVCGWTGSGLSGPGASIPSTWPMRARIKAAGGGDVAKELRAVAAFCANN